MCPHLAGGTGTGSITRRTVTVKLSGQINIVTMVAHTWTLKEVGRRRGPLKETENWHVRVDDRSPTVYQVSGRELDVEAALSWNQAPIDLGDPSVHISSQLCVWCHHVGNLKLAKMGVFIAQQSATLHIRACVFNQLSNVHWHITG